MGFLQERITVPRTLLEISEICKAEKKEKFPQRCWNNLQPVNVEANLENLSPRKREHKVQEYVPATAL